MIYIYRETFYHLNNLHPAVDLDKQDTIHSPAYKSISQMTLLLFISNEKCNCKGSLKRPNPNRVKENQMNF